MRGKRPGIHEILSELERSDGIPHPDAPQSMGGLTEPKAYEGIEVTANKRPAGWDKDAWRIPGRAQKPLQRKEEEQEDPLKPRPIHKAQIAFPRVDHDLDERSPTRAELRDQGRMKRRVDRVKRHERLVALKEASLQEGFVKQDERRRKADRDGDDGPTGSGI